MKGRLVSLVKGESRKENIFEALRLIQKYLLPFKKAKTVLVKPNFTSAYNPTASTQGEAVEAVLEFLKELDSGFGKKKIALGEASGEAYARGESIIRVFERFGYGRIFKKYKNVSVWDVSQEKNFFSVLIKTIKEEKIKVRIPKKILDFDYKISITSPKTHDTVGVTLTIKNFLMGIIKPEDKFLMHGYGYHPAQPEKMDLLAKILNRLAHLANKKAPWQALWFFNNFAPAWVKDKSIGFDPKEFVKSVAYLNQNLFTLSQKTMPDLGIIDGWWGMDKDGPVYGRRRNLKVTIASTDPVAADMVGTQVMSFDPKKIGYLRLLTEAARDRFPRYQLVGEKISTVRQQFQPHRHFEYQLEGVKYPRCR